MFKKITFLFVILSISIKAQIPVDPGNLTAYRGSFGAEYEFTITGSSAASGGWGTLTYTDDSPCALMAVHAGEISAGEKKIVKFQIMPGQLSYSGSTRYGVTTSDFGNWLGSYEVVSSRPLETPGSQASNISFSNIQYDQMQINWTKGSGEYCIVFLKQGNSGTAVPADYETYTSNASFGSGTQIGETGWYCVYKGAGSSVTVTNLNGTTEYIAHVIDYNYGASFESYCTSAGTNNPRSQATSLLVTPTIQASEITFSNVDSRQMTINWTNGNGIRRAVFIKQANSGTASPEDNSTYSASTTLGSGSQIGSTGWYCIYNGSGSNVTVSALSSATPYIVQVFEYNGSPLSERYMTGSASNNPNSISTLSKTTISPPPNNLTGFRYTNQSYELTLTGTTTGGGIWGDNPYYTDDSYCPMAAVHSGCIVPGEKRIVVFRVSTGRDSYAPVTRHGITSSFYGAFDGSYSVIQSFPLEVPSIQANNVILSNIQETQIDINWTRGNGDYCIVFVKQGNSGTASPENYITYTPNSSFGSGTQIDETGWFCVYKGTGSSVTVTDLSASSQYIVHVVEYNYGETFETYNSSASENNPRYDTALPVELSTFQGSRMKNKVVLKWITATEVNNYGFEVERQVGSPKDPADMQSAVGNQNNPNSEIRNLKWEIVGFVQGSGNSNSPKEYCFVDEHPANGKNIYRLKQIDNDGTFAYSSEIEIDFKEIPVDFALFNNYPNPANPATTIKFGLPVRCYVNVEVYNTLGERIALLADETKDAGFHEVRWDGSNVSSGIYFYTIRAKEEGGSKEFKTVKKMLIMK